MNKKTIAVIAISLLIGGISLAALLDYYGIIIGSGDVKRPRFYIGSAISEVLLLDEKPTDCSYFYLENSNTRTFVTEEDFKGVNFNYVPKAQFSVRASVEATNGTTTPQNLYLKFGYIDASGPVAPICFATVFVSDTMNNYTTGPIQCSAKPKNVKHFFLEMTGDCDNCLYTISKCEGGFYTKIELEK